MGTTLVEYFIDELVDWNHLITSDFGEMSEFENKLTEVVQRNTIPNIAAKVEEQQDKLNAVSAKFKKLLIQIQQQEAAFKKDHMPIDDTLINPESEKAQNGLRRSMQQTEKEYIDAKFDCYNFLSQIFRK